MGGKEKERGRTERRREFEEENGASNEEQKEGKGRKVGKRKLRKILYLQNPFKQSSHTLSDLADIQGMLCNLTIHYSIYFIVYHQLTLSGNIESCQNSDGSFGHSKTLQATVWCIQQQHSCPRHQKHSIVVSVTDIRSEDATNRKRLGRVFNKHGNAWPKE